MTTLRNPSPGVRATRPLRHALLTATALCMALSGLSPAAQAAPENAGRATNLAQGLRRTLLVFPFDTPKAVKNQDDVRNLLTDAALSRLEASQLYTTVLFRRGLGPVARAINEQQLSEADVSEPFGADNAKATKIAKLLGYDVAFLGSVDDYQYSDADKQATITISGRLLDIATGKITKSATLSAQSSKGGRATEQDRALEAARSGAERLMSQLVPFTSVTPLPPSQGGKTKAPSSGHKRRADTGWIVGLLVVGLGIGLGIASGSSGSGGGGTGGGGGLDGPPPPPR